MSYGIHWFRRDLRVAGNEALRQNFAHNKGRVVGVFCFDKKFLSRPDFSHNRFALFLDTLVELKKELISLGGDLLVLDGIPQESWPKILETVAEPPSLVTWSRDYEPFARQRDEGMQEFFEQNSVAWKSFRDHLVVEPWELEKKAGEGYKVYTPFSRKWLSLLRTSEFQARVQDQKLGLNLLESRDRGEEIKPFFKLRWDELDLPHELKDSLEEYRLINQKSVTIPIPKAGSLQAYRELKKFKERIDGYGENRDIPKLNGTSGLSKFLKNGSLTTSQIICYLGLEAYQEKKSGRDIFLSELIWREFYYHILYRYPEVESKEFMPKYRGLPWNNAGDNLEKWKQGRTGYPIVDAGMRELNQTGHMHNRVRMIVASFLTKHLLIDWREGERYFMKMLLDGDVAANNGGWQWAASTGCDAQPYFRIFNPWSQSKKFDPEGEYIKKYVPELAELDSKLLHAPITDLPGYPAPIVEHSEARQKALQVYKEHGS